VIVTGLADGQVDVTAELHADRPATPDLTGWEDVAEIGIDWPGGEIRVIGAAVIPPSILTAADAQPPGLYRLFVAGEKPAPKTNRSRNTSSASGGYNTSNATQRSKPPANWANSGAEWDHGEVAGPAGRATTTPVQAERPSPSLAYIRG
jgi:hypothetical protein